jgi:hypothetical protein
VSDRVRLLALELQRAGLALAQMVALVTTRWLALPATLRQLTGGGPAQPPVTPSARAVHPNDAPASTGRQRPASAA